MQFTTILPQKMICQSDNENCRSVSMIGSILFPPPPSVFYDLQLKIICCYIARFYVKKIARGPGGHKKFMLTKLGGTELIVAAAKMFETFRKGQTTKFLNPITLAIDTFIDTLVEFTEEVRSKTDSKNFINTELSDL